MDGIREVYLPPDPTKSRARVKACFSEVYDHARENPYHPDSTTKRTLLLNVHSAALVHFRVGSLWKNGELFFDPQPLPDYFEVDTREAKFVRLSSPISMDGVEVERSIPYSCFRLGKNWHKLSDTYYVHLKVLNSNNRTPLYITLPASEVYRFYVGVSERFASAALTRTLHEYFDKGKSVSSSTSPLLHVNGPISKYESFTLLRALSSEYALSSLYAAHQHLSQTSENNKLRRKEDQEPLVLIPKFPFAGRTKLRVAGTSGYHQEIDPVTGQRIQSIFAMQILHCTHPTTFFDPTIQKDEVISNKRPGRGIYGSSVDLEELGIQDGDAILIEDGPADANIRRISMRTISNRFLALKHLKYNYQNINKIGKKSFMPKSEADPEGFTLGDGNYSSESEGKTGVSGHEHPDEGSSRDISLFIKTIKEIQLFTKSRGWSITTRTLEEKITPGEYNFTSFPEKELAGKLSWYKIKHEPGGPRSRHVVWVEINLQDNYYIYLSELELRPKEGGHSTAIMQTLDFSKMENSTFSKFLKLTAINNRWPDESTYWSNAKDTNAAAKFFDEIFLRKVNHPPFIKKFQKEDAQNDKILNSTENESLPSKWAEYIVEQIDNFINYQSTNAL
ncbi:hypothetical protein [Microbulbifer litoralis]|uniref:hypothetical protein n=1 Tax=Microbulbifer litoralis TaxID=2933965 RepID=UPI0020281BAA|nr:hypothetical protein [Microbulbifer sp. GX H0434]